MRQCLLKSLLAVAAVMTLARPAMAVVDGQPDGNDHPYVGLVVMYDGDGFPIWRCSGTLLSPTVFLTAGHCTAQDELTGDTPVFAQVYFGYRRW